MEQPLASRPAQRDDRGVKLSTAVMAYGSLRGFGLSLAFQAQLSAYTHPCNERDRAANASERPWRTAKCAARAKG